MQTLAESLQKLRPIDSKQLQCEQPKQEVTLHQDSQARQALTAMLYQCFQSLKLYGKEPEAFDDIASMFNLVLADYPFDKIKSAFAFYLKYNNELPTPADIANIIERGNRPPLDKAVYVAISKKFPELRDADDWKYMREYERFMVSGRN